MCRALPPASLTTLYVEDKSAPPVRPFPNSQLAGAGSCTTNAYTGLFTPVLTYNDVLPAYTPPLHLEAVACPYAPVAPVPSGAPPIIAALLLLAGVGWLLHGARRSSGVAS